MGISRRLIDLARANLNALLEKAAPETSVDELTDEELQAELERRKQRRLREEEERKSRESAERAARERAAQRQAAQKQAPGAQKPPPKRPTQSARRPPLRPAPPGTERHLRDLYAQLEVPYGSDFETVKHSFRRLMRKYHPDLHVGNPVKQKTATELTMSLTQAYNELEEHLRKR